MPSTPTYFQEAREKLYQAILEPVAAK
jgi:hypothetical protein